MVVLSALSRPGLPWNGGPACRGIPARHHVESRPDMPWNPQSGDRSPGRGGKLPPVGDTVDVQTATYTNAIGSAELIGTWVDPDFNPARPALYYVRVLEIPTPRWTTFDAVRNKLALLEDVPATIQERAWTSPIWYTPEQ